MCEVAQLNIELKTPRLLLRKLRVDDARAIFSYAKKPEVSQYTMWEPHTSVADSEAYIREYAGEYYSKGVPEPLGITLLSDSSRVIGTVGCFWVSEKSRSMELAYALAPDYWGEGIASEASSAVVDYCAREFSLKRVQARCKTENLASVRVMQKIGMQFEGTLRSSLFHRDRFWDMHIYAKIF